MPTTHIGARAHGEPFAFDVREDFSATVTRRLTASLILHTSAPKANNDSRRPSTPLPKFEQRFIPSLFYNPIRFPTPRHIPFSPQRKIHQRYPTRRRHHHHHHWHQPFLYEVIVAL